MKLEHLSEYIMSACVIGGGMFLAVFIGISSGGGDISRVAVLLGCIVALVGIIALNRNLWLLIPPTWFLVGHISLLPVPFTVRELVILAVWTSALMLTALKVLRKKPAYTGMDVLMLVNVLYLATCFVRNPVGFDSMNSEIVGGRPYFDVIIALMAYWVLVRVRATARLANMVPLLCMCTAGVLAVASVLLWFVPSLYPIFVPFYSDFDPAGYLAGDTSRGPAPELVRIIGLQDLGKQGGIALCALFHPLSLLSPRRLWRFMGLVIVGLALLFSGFRSFVFYVGVMFVLGSYFRTGMRGLIQPIVVGSLVLFMVVLGQGNIYDLPLPAQRALSFLPGKWNSLAVDSGRGSTEWRVVMWKTVLSSDRYIRNRVLGDGFGILRRDFASVLANSHLLQTDDLTRETAMIAGDYHSGPISTLKFVGIPGLLFFYGLMVVMLKEAVRIIKRARGTPFFCLALFVGMPIVFRPFWFTLIFGGYNGDLAEVIFGVGMLKLVGQSLDDYLAQHGHSASNADSSASAPEHVGRARRSPGQIAPWRPELPARRNSYAA